jgi:PAS domain S-box-containing protein
MKHNTISSEAGWVQKLRGWMAPPSFEGVADSRRAQIVNAIAWAGLIASLLFGPVALILLPLSDPQVLINFVVIAVMILTLFLLRKRWLNWASAVLLFLIAQVASYSAFLNGGTKNLPFASGLLFMVILGSILLTRLRHQLILAAIVAGMALIVAVMESNGAVPPPLLRDPVAVWFEQVISMGLALTLLYYAGHSWNTAHQNALIREADLIADAAELENRLADQTQHIKQFEALIEGNMQGILVSRAGKLLFCNQTTADMLGYGSAEELLAVEQSELLIAEHDRDKLHNLRNEIDLESGGSYRVELEVFHQDGHLMPMALIVGAIDWDGERAVQNTLLDLSRLAEAELALRESEARLNVMVEHMPVMVNAWDSAGAVVTWNKHSELMTGFSSEEIMIGRDGLKLLFPKPGQVEQMDELWSTIGNDYSDVEWEIASKSGDTRILSHSNTSKDHPIPGWSGWSVAVDVTDRRLAEEALAKKSAEFESIIRAMPDAVVFTDADRRIQLINPAFTAILGYDLSEIRGLHTKTIYSSDEDFEEQGRLLFNLSAEDQLAPYKVRYRRKSGELFSGETVGSAVRAADGVVIGYLGVIRDVTQRERTKADLEASESRYRLLFESMEFGLAYFDIDLCLQMTNAQTLVGPGQDPADFIGRHADEFIMPSLKTSVSARLRQAVRQNTVGIYEDALDDAYWRSTYHPVRDRDDVILGVQVSFQDITERKRAEVELRQMNEMLEERVSERTAEMRKVISSMSGREIRMAELKQVIVDLRNQLIAADIEPAADDPLRAQSVHGPDDLDSLD